MKKRRCQLCGGRLVNQICVECGLDNSKTDDNYRTNAYGCEHEKMTHVHSDTESPYAGKTMTKEERARATKAEIRRKGQGQGKTGAGNASYPTAGGTKSQNRRTGAAGKIITAGIVISVVSSIVGSVVPAIYNEVKDIGWNSSKDSWDSNTEESYNEDEAVYTPYENVQRELSPEGEEYEVTLTAGLYNGGVQLPEGAYTATLESGEGEIDLDDSENGIYLTQSFGEDSEYSVTEMDDLRIYKGGILTVNNSLVIHLKSVNAQMDLTGIANPNTESKTISDKIMVGKDIPAGVYDIKCTEGNGIFEFDIPQGDYQSYEGMLLGADTAHYPDELKNIVLPEGVEVTITDMTVILTPSETIVSEDYDTYYQW